MAALRTRWSTLRAPVVAVVGFMTILAGSLLSVLILTPARAAPFPGVVPVAGTSSLRGVTCRSATDCVAVGVGRVWFANDACDRRHRRWVEGSLRAAIKNAYAIHSGLRNELPWKD